MLVMVDEMNIDNTLTILQVTCSKTNQQPVYFCEENDRDKPLNWLIPFPNCIVDII